MSDISVHTRLRQAWFTSVISIVSIAAFGLILEIAMGSKPMDLFTKSNLALDGTQQVRMELTLLGKVVADDPDSYPADLGARLKGIKDSIAAGLDKLRKSGFKAGNEKAFKLVETYFNERFLPDFENFRRPSSEQDRSEIQARLRVSRNELESRLGVMERSLIQFSTKDYQEMGQIKMLSAAGGCILGAIGLGVLWFQVRALHKEIALAIQQAAPVTGADAKMAENIAKYASRIRELEGGNKLLRAEVDKLAPLADEV
ncbi:MAG: hypothetical protein RLZZ356_1018, partial [Verrucomicrobiota bacterium]